MCLSFQSERKRKGREKLGSEYDFRIGVKVTLFIIVFNFKLLDGFLSCPSFFVLSNIIFKGKLLQ